MSRRKYTHRLQVLVPEALAARLRRATDRRRMSRGEWVRRAIERSLAGEMPETDPLSAPARLGAPTADIERMLREIEDGRA